MASVSNSGGVSGTKGLSKSGSARVNGSQPGSARGEGPAASGKGSPGKGGVRPNGKQPAGLGEAGENQNYRQSYARNAESMKPTKSGGVR
jgi:hypothetical protein